MRVSVIIPTYNRSREVVRAVKSVLTQTYRDLECIVVDDFSTDNTLEELEGLKKQDNRLKIIAKKKNSGAPDSRNIGMGASTGEYISFLDSDDEYLPTKIEKQLEVFQTSTLNNLGVVTCGREDIRDGMVYFKWIPTHRGNIVTQLLSKDRVGAGTPFLMISRDVFKSGILFDPLMPAGQDWDFLIRICQKYTLDFVAEPLVRVHHHTGERIYNAKNVIKALDLQHQKYKHLLILNREAYSRFLIKYSSLLFIHNNRNKALNLLKSAPSHSLKIILWRCYFMIFSSVNSLPSRAVLKLLNSVTFN